MIGSLTRTTKTKTSLLASVARRIQVMALPLILPLALGGVMTGAFSILSVDDANAQRAKRNNQQAEEPIEGRQFGAKAGEIVNEAQTEIAEERHSAGLAILAKALALPDLNPYEKATIYQMQGGSYYALDQYPASIQAFENAIASGGLLPKEKSSLRVSIAQLLIGDGQFVKGAQMLEDWNRNGGQLKDTHVEMLWQAVV